MISFFYLVIVFKIIVNRSSFNFFAKMKDSEVLLEVAETKKKDDGRRLAERSLNDLTVFTKPNREEFVHNIFSQELNFGKFKF